MHCMLMDLLHGFEVLSTTEETLFNSRNVSRLVQNNLVLFKLLNSIHQRIRSKREKVEIFLFDVAFSDAYADVT